LKSTVIKVGGYFDEEFARWSIKLFAEFEEGLHTAVISDITLRELCRSTMAKPG
jgi:hypothetical protein